MPTSVRPLTWSPTTDVSDQQHELRPDWEMPLPERLPPTNPRRHEILERHADALAKNLPTYIDPVSGFSVFTAKFLATRDDCCASGCRHCPYI